MNEYIFHWRDGTTSTGKGETPEQALNHDLGYGYGAVSALDYWEQKQPSEDDRFREEWEE